MVGRSTYGLGITEGYAQYLQNRAVRDEAVSPASGGKWLGPSQGAEWEKFRLFTDGMRRREAICLTGLDGSTRFLGGVGLHEDWESGRVEIGRDRGQEIGRERGRGIDREHGRDIGPGNNFGRRHR